MFLGLSLVHGYGTPRLIHLIKSAASNVGSLPNIKLRGMVLILRRDLLRDSVLAQKPPVCECLKIPLFVLLAWRDILCILCTVFSILGGLLDPLSEFLADLMMTLTILLGDGPLGASSILGFKALDLRGQYFYLAFTLVFLKFIDIFEGPFRWLRERSRKRWGLKSRVEILFTHPELSLCLLHWSGFSWNTRIKRTIKVFISPESTSGV